MKQDPPSPAPFRYDPTDKERMNFLTQVIHRTSSQYRSADVPPLARPLDPHEVEDYCIHRLPHTDVPDVISHVIHFVGGVFFSFLMDESGTILETIRRRVAASIDQARGVMTLHGSCMPDDLTEQH